MDKGISIKDYAIRKQSILEDLIKYNGNKILESVVLSILYSSAYKIENFDEKVANNFYKLTLYVQKHNYQLMDYNYFIILLFNNLLNINYYFEIHFNNQKYVSQYGKSNFTISNKTKHEIINSIINELSHIIKKHYYFNTDKVAFSLDYRLWLDSLILQLGVSNDRSTIFRHDDLYLNRIEEHHLLDLAFDESFIFLSELSKCILYPEYMNTETWLDNVVDTFHKLTLYIDEDSNKLFDFDKVIDDLLVCSDMFDDYFEVWGNLDAYSNKYGKSLLINDKYHFHLIMKLVNENLKEVLRKHYYINTNKENLKDSLLVWLDMVISKLGYNKFTNSYLYDFENMPNQDRFKEEWTTDKLYILERQIQGSGSSITQYIAKCIQYPDAIFNEKWDYLIAKEFYLITKRVYKPTMELLDFDYMIVLLFGNIGHIYGYFDIDSSHDEYIDKYGYSKYVNNQENLSIVTGSIVNELAQIIKKHYYFNTNQERFRLEYLNWLDETLKKVVQG